MEIEEPSGVRFGHIVRSVRDSFRKSGMLGSRGRGNVIRRRRKEAWEKVVVYIFEE